MLPIIGIGGQAGAGKDTVAGMMMKLQPGSVAIAQANPLKWLGLHGFGFTESQLWGPSENRNAVDGRYSEQDAWRDAHCTLFGGGVAQRWIDMVGIGSVESLERWFDRLEDSFRDTKDFSPRLMLQLLGTEYAREINPNVWSELGIKTALKLLHGGHKYSNTTGLTTNPKAPPAPMVFITDLRFPNEVVGIKSIGGKVLKVTSGTTTIATTHASEASLSQIPDFWWDVVLHNNKLYGLDALRASVRKVHAHLAPYPFTQSTKLFVLDRE